MSFTARLSTLTLSMALSLGLTAPAQSTESLFGFVKGAETLPQGAMELYQIIKRRSDKGQGDYTAYNLSTELEYGVSNRFSAGAAIKMQSLETSGLIIDGYLPKAVDSGLKFSGLEGSMKYMFLSPALDDIGLAGYMSFNYDWVDPHSGQDKDTYSLETELLAQKYFLEGELIWAANAGVEATYADRAEISDLPEDFEWPTDPEMEIELKLGSGLSYRFAPNWFIGLETFYETEFETEVGQERWSWFAGPSIHYGAADWWATLTWFNQLSGGGEQYESQLDDDLHLIEKTKNEVKLVVAFNF
ncbi:DUF6662 family protein [Bowmanella dokdonensis]|uniref:Uncharacterized protein n=1 Tax=Bowmanella dokdonensis TaxID=751969 RepID=A0A939IQC1_9ALTE|nr:DUF6662 family protein [Bowmanella dokdonensis]MBN7826785.1 hypothetical protein [Bowmanella dokdonensis]